MRALTGMEPDRYAEEQRLAFVDVTGHERFVPTVLAGVGPVPVVVLAVVADGDWMPQRQKHDDALDALQVRHGLLGQTGPARGRLDA